MPLFRLVSDTPPETLAVEFYGNDADEAFSVAKRARLAEAELWRGREYIFTLRRHGGEGEYRIIHRPPAHARSEARSAPTAKPLS